MIKYLHENEHQQTNGFMHARPAASAEVVHQPREQRLPALRTRGELELMEIESITEVALRGVANLTQVIAELQPSDPETYGLMLGLRADFAEAAKHRIRGQTRRW